MYFSEPRSCSLILWSACAFLSAVSSAAFADEKEKPVSANDLEAVEMGLVFNPVVRHTDTGRPVTLRQQTIINMAKKIVEIRRRSGDDAEDHRPHPVAGAFGEEFHEGFAAAGDEPHRRFEAGDGDGGR